jgi:ribonucleoside-diphosphate reductase alpha chain
LNQMAAAQPFLSGAISKTINLPEEATFEDIAKAYTESWKKMTKAVALYRDGSKLSQPLNAHSADEAFAKLFDFSTIEDVNETIGAKELQTAAIQAAPAPKRRRLPDERHSITHKFSVGGQSGYITVGLYEDGTPGEIFMFMQKTGSTLRGIMDVLGVSLSWNLQYGVPLEELIRKLTYVRFEPAGMTGNKEIPIAKSIFDYIGRWLAIKFLKPEVAKKYHSSELVNYSYEQGSNARILIPFINGKGRTELSTSRLTKTPSLEDVIEQAEAEEQVLIEEVRPEASYTLAESTGSTGVGTISQIELDLGAEEAILQRLSKQQEQKSMASDDAEICSECGSVMVRQGNCFFCRECGSTSGCS